MTARVYVGTSSFADVTMIPYFYPRNLKPGERLSYYARFFNTVEIDSSFYALPSERNSFLFAQRTPQDFIIHFKAFRLMTLHQTPVESLPRSLRELLPSKSPYVLRDFPSAELKERCFKIFFQALLPLKYVGKLGYILFQFPPWFKKNDDSIEYLMSIRKLLPEAKIAIEFRNGTWTLRSELEDTLKLLQKSGFVFTIVDEPQVGIYGSIPPIYVLTARDAYIRFHGLNKEAWLKKGASVHEKFRYFYTEEELRPHGEKVKELKKYAENIYVFFNNCFAYYALKNARMFADMIDALKDREQLKLIFPDDQPELPFSQ
jgi:uncharacterized protein YecE (DUF72 family)